jgi:hypothetical protein
VHPALELHHHVEIASTTHHAGTWQHHDEEA